MGWSYPGLLVSCCKIKYIIIIIWTGPMASKEAALDSKLQSLSRDELIHFVKKQAAQVSKLKQNQLQQASTSG